MKTYLAAIPLSLLLIAFASAKEILISEYDIPPCTSVEWREVKVTPWSSIRQPEPKFQSQIAIVKVVVHGKNIENSEFDEPLRKCSAQTYFQLSLVGITLITPDMQKLFGDTFRQCVAKRAKSADIQSVFYDTENSCVVNIEKVIANYDGVPEGVMHLFKDEFAGELGVHIGMIRGREDPALTIFRPDGLSWAADGHFTDTGPLRGPLKREDIFYHDTLYKGNPQQDLDARVAFIVVPGRRYVLSGSLDRPNRTFSYKVMRIDGIRQQK